MRSARLCFALLLILTAAISPAQGQSVSEDQRELFLRDSINYEADYKELKSLYRSGEYRRGRQLGMETAALAEQTFGGRDNKEVGDVLYYLGNHCRKLGLYDEAVKHYGDYLDYRLRHPEDQNRALQSVYGNMGVAYHENNDYEQGLFHYQKALELCINDIIGVPDSIGIITSYINMGNLMVETDRTEEGIRYHKMALDIQRKFRPDDAYQISRHYKNLAHAFFCLTDEELPSHMDSSRYYSEQALQIRTSILGPEHHKTGNMYLAMGSQNRDQGLYEEAIPQLKKAAEIYHKTGREGWVVSRALHGIANSYYHTDQFDQCLTWGDSTLKFLMPHWRPTNSEALPPVEILPIHRSSFKTIRLIGDTHYKIFQQTGDVQALEKSHRYYLLLLDLIDRIRLSFMTHSAKQEMASDYHLVYGKLIEIERSLQQSSKALAASEQASLKRIFTYFERSKAAILLDAIRDTEAREFADIPQAEQEKELQLKLTFNEVLEELDDLSNDPAANALRDSLQAQLTDLKLERDVLIKRFERDYPSYYELKYSKPEFDLEAIQNRLGPEEGVLEYFAGEDKLLAMGITHENFWLEEVDLSIDSLLVLVKQFRDGVTGSFLDGSKGLWYYDSLYIAAASELHRVLLKPHSNRLPYDLTIIPDGPLGYLSFDLLLTEAVKQGTNYAALPYAMKQHAFNYLYNGLLHTRSKGRSKRQKAAVFNPNFTGGALPLTYSTEESQHLRKQLGATLFSAGQATTEAFIKEAPKFDILHISSHGVLNEENPMRSYILFESNDETTEAFDQLYLSDVYSLPLESHLVVLSACETGAGNFENGAGINSLAHGFTYSGAESLVTTLWPINDAFSADFMVKFYSSLRPGLLARNPAKHVALREAKVAAMQENRHPFLWGGFIAMGNMEPLPARNGLSTDRIFRWAALTVAFLFLLALYRRNRALR